MEAVVTRDEERWAAWDRFDVVAPMTAPSPRIGGVMISRESARLDRAEIALQFLKEAAIAFAENGKGVDLDALDAAARAYAEAVGGER